MMRTSERHTRLFGSVEYSRGFGSEFRNDRDLLRAIDQTRAAQQRREIFDLTVVIQHLVVQRGEEFRQTHAFLRRDLLQSVPKRHFEPDRRAVSVDPERSRLRFIVALRLMRE